MDITIDNISTFRKFNLFAIMTVVEKFIKLKKIKRKRKHGFRKRQSSHSGRKVLKRRILSKRRRVTV